MSRLETSKDGIEGRQSNPTATISHTSLAQSQMHHPTNAGGSVVLTTLPTTTRRTALPLANFAPAIASAGIGARHFTTASTFLLLVKAALVNKVLKPYRMMG